MEISTNIKFIVIYLVAINSIAFIMYRLDKFKSQQSKRRVSERTLLLLAMVGGSVGSIFGMYFGNNHKSNKIFFKLGVPIILLVHFFVFFYFLK